MRVLAAENDWNTPAAVLPLSMTNELKIISVKLPISDLRRIRGNRSDFVRQTVVEKLERESSPEWKPATALGRKFLKLREQFLANGGELLDAEGIDQELQERRGGLR